MFQNFDAPTNPADGPPRLAALRERLAQLGLAGFIVPRADRHQGEYVAPCDERLSWLTGFTGSAGFCAVLPEIAGVFIDGRYRVQVKSQVDLAVFTPVAWPETSLGDWLVEAAPEGARIGFDPWLHTVKETAALEQKLEAAGLVLVPLSANPVDAIWQDRPPEPAAPIVAHPIEFAGESSEDKRTRLAADLIKAGVDAAVLTQPDSICWLLNIRGADIARNPVARVNAILLASGACQLFCAPEQVEGGSPTQRTDIYSLGIVLYEMLTGGRRPFIGRRASISGSSTKRIRWEQVNLMPESPRVYNRAISADVESVVMRCLEKEPAKRFSSTMELIDALQRAIKIRTTRKKPVDRKKKKPADTKRKKTVRKKRKKQPINNQWLVWVGAAALILILLFFAIKPTIPASKGNLFIELWNKSIDKRTTIDMTICNWDSRDQEAIITIERPDGTQREPMDLSGCCNLLECDGKLRPAWKFYLTPDADELPGLWKVTFKGTSTGRTASLSFRVDP